LEIFIHQANMADNSKQCTNRFKWKQ